MSSKAKVDLKQWFCSWRKLGFPASLDTKTLSTAYRKFAGNHPDADGDSEEMQGINAARNYLKENREYMDPKTAYGSLGKTVEQFFPHTDMRAEGNEEILLKLSGEYNDCE